MKKVITALLILVCAALGTLLYLSEKNEDRTPPTVIFPEEEVLLEEGEDTARLLDGVRAVDDVDGDVSDTLVVESVIPMEGGETATVLYYAKDRSNNLVKASRRVGYHRQDAIPRMEETEAETETETEAETEEWLPSYCPRITLTTDRVTVNDGESYNLLSYVKDITDDEDGPDWLYGQIHIEGMHDISGPGTYRLIYTVVDRQGNQSNDAVLTLTVR